MFSEPVLFSVDFLPCLTKGLWSSINSAQRTTITKTSATVGSFLLREHFIALGKKYDVECVESVILSMDWLFDGTKYQTFYRRSDEHMEITIKQYNGNEEVTPKVYNTSNKQNLEVLRDLCLPMVYNW